MKDRRLVGIDLGITSAHTVRVPSGDGRVVCRRKAVPTLASLGEVEQAALAGTVPGTRLEVVVEPTGPAWRPIAVFFTRQGHTVYRVSSAKAHDLRRVLSRHAKSNGIDADTLARLPLVDPAGLHPLELPDAERAALDRRVRACDRLTQAAAGHQRPIKDLVGQPLPASPLTGELGQADLAVLERYADPHALLAAGQARLTRLIARASNHHLGAERPPGGCRPPRPRWSCTATTPPSPAPTWPPKSPPRCGCCAPSRPSWPATPPNARPATGGSTRVAGPLAARLAEVGGPALVATMGPASRFATAAKFRSFTGLAHEHPRPARSTGRASRSARPATGCCGPPFTAPPTPPAS
jgi:transposase